MAIIRRKSGFTLVEIMVVVAIILIVMTLALPNILRSRMNANEVAAIAHCRLISTACQSYYSNSIPHVYPNSLEDLIEPNSSPAYIDTTLASGEKQGYIFTYDLVNEDSFTLNAAPRTPGRTGVRYFYTDETGVIRNKNDEEAGPDDPPVSG
ncbi:MAG: type II secretion system protein [Candidatus Omnitrophica bacterium]|nr:type II secretion system protein [Candidatus Omnitrophota bacterium]MDD5355555.1 type II secretion system protein [Candidatus Omnitrophota bacterium]